MSDMGSGDTPNGSAEAPVKTAKQLEKEAKKAAKLAKLQEKLDKKAAADAEAPKEVSLIHDEIFVRGEKLFEMIIVK